MKLNPDCIRDILLYLEDNLKVDLIKKDFNKISYLDLCEHFQDIYANEDIWYTIYNLNSIHFIEGDIKNAGSYNMFFCDVKNITWGGHQFLNTIRQQSIWDATKQGASKLGIVSIHALNTIAMKLAESIITNPDVIAKISERLLN